MKRIKIFLILAVLTFFIAACTTATPATATEAQTVFVPTIAPTVVVEGSPSASDGGLPQTEADVPRVSVNDVVAAIQSGKAVIVDVRSAQAYQASHIIGAVSIPLAEIENNPTGLKLDKDQWIITYCT